MAISVRGIENVTSNKAHLNLKGKSCVLAPKRHSRYNSATEDSSSFEARFPVGKDNRAFRVYGGDSTLEIEEEFSEGHETLNVIRDHGEYKMILDDRGLTIEDISKQAPTLQLEGEFFRYYKFSVVNGAMQAEGSIHYAKS